MLTKMYPCQVKVVSETADQGVVEMVVSTYGVDSWKEQVIPGAFAETLAEFKASGDPLPFIFAHQHENPDMYVGSIVDAAEQNGDPTTTPPTPAGMWIKATMDLEDAPARKVFKLLKSRRVKQASFAYDVLEGAEVTKDGDKIYELRKLKLYEAGPCLIGMNPETELLGVKDAKTLRHILADFKAGRVISAKNEELLRSAHDSIGTVLAALDEAGKADTKTAIAVHHTDTSDAAWDGAAAEANLKLDQTAAYYRKAYAWQDPEKDETTKAAYKFPHHMVDADGNIGAANIKAAQTGIGVLNGGRGGTTIPEDDKKGVWSHLAAHITDSGNEPPELKTAQGEPVKDEDPSGKSDEPMRPIAALDRLDHDLKVSALGLSD